MTNAHGSSVEKKQIRHSAKAYTNAALELEWHRIAHLKIMFTTYSVGKISGFAALLGVLTAIPAAGQLVQDPPPELSFLSTILKVRKNIAYEAWGEVKFPPNRDVGPARQGKHWFILAEAANGADMVAEWNKIKPVFLHNGWTIVKEYRSGGFAGGAAVLEERRAGLGERGQRLPDFSTGRDRNRAAALYLTLAAPAATPEKIATDTGDFPYLALLPGSKFHRGAADNTPFRVTPAGAQQAEIVANGTLYRNYDFPGISNVLLTTAYRDALTKGGWAIVEERTSVIWAHYAQKGRNIWAMVSPEAGGYTLNVADAGLVDLGQTWRRRATSRSTACCSTSTNRPCSRLPRHRCNRWRI